MWRHYRYRYFVNIHDYITCSICVFVKQINKEICMCLHVFHEAVTLSNKCQHKHHRKKIKLSSLAVPESQENIRFGCSWKKARESVPAYPVSRMKVGRKPTRRLTTGLGSQQAVHEPCKPISLIKWRQAGIVKKPPPRFTSLTDYGANDRSAHVPTTGRFVNETASGSNI